MKSKKIVTCIVLIALALASLSSCGVDKKCPAYSQAETTDTINYV